MLILNRLPNDLIWYYLVLLFWEIVETLTWEHKQETNSLSPASFSRLKGPSLINFSTYRMLVHLCSSLVILSKICVFRSSVVLLYFCGGQNSIQYSSNGWYTGDLHWQNIFFFFVLFFFVHNYSECFICYFPFSYTLSLLSAVCSQMLSWEHFSVHHYIITFSLCILLHIY